MKDFLRRYNFRVIIPGFGEAGFSTCTGLSAKSLFTKIKQAGASAPVLLHDGYEFPPITFSRGQSRTNSDAYFWWECAALMNTPANLLVRRNVIVEVYGRDSRGLNALRLKGTPVRYLIYGAQIETLEIGEMEATDPSNAVVLIERFSIVHQGIERIQAGAGLI